MPSINDRIKQFFAELTTDAEQERVIEYVIRELRKGRRLTEAVEDPFVRNRMNDEKRAQVFENPEIMDALEAEIRESMTRPDIDFG